MVSKSKSKSGSKKTYFAFGLLLILLASLCLALYRFFPAWLEEQLTSWMQKAGIESPRVEVSDWGTGHLELSSMQGQYEPGYLLEGTFLTTFTPKSLWNKQLDKIFLSRLDLQVHLSPALWTVPDPATPATTSLSLPKELPFKELFINESLLELIPEQGPVRRYQIQGVLNPGPARRFYLEAAGTGETVSLGGEWDLSRNTGHINLNVSTDRPNEWLAYLPEAWPQPQLDSVMLEALYRLPPSGQASWLTNITVPGLTLENRSWTVNLPLSHGGLTGEGRHWRHLWLSLHGGQSDSLFGKLQWDRISAEASPEQLQGLVQGLRFILPSGDISAVIPSLPFTARLPDGFPLSSDSYMPPHLTLGPSDVTAKGKQWQTNLSALHVRFKNDETEGPFEINFKDGAMTWMNQEGELNGIRGTIFMNPRQSWFPITNSEGTFQELQQGQLIISEGKWSFSTVEDSDWTNLILTGNVLGGQMDAMFRLNPIDLAEGDLAIKLSHIDLDALSALFPDFNAHISGHASGELPVSFRGKQLSFKPGYLEMDPDSNCRLSYTRNGWLTQDPSINIEQLLTEMEVYQILQLPQGGSIITEAALRDLKVSKLRVELFEDGQLERPILIQIEGTSSLKGVSVPIILDVPVRGTLEELLNLLLNIDLEQLTRS